MIILLAYALVACTGDVHPLENPFVFKRADGFPEPFYTFENNPVTQQGFELGRALFYDPILSLDSTIACANCHQQARAFSDPVHRFSKGVGDNEGIRNAPAIQNLAYQKSFFWDGGAKHLDFVPINAVTNPIEMAESIGHVLVKLKRSSLYPMMFENAFGQGDITSQKMLFALSQFMCLMNSSSSRYDKHVSGDDNLSNDELTGLKLFEQNCQSCHATLLFTDGSFRNNGLDVTFDLDSGRVRITEDATDRGKFKVPALRNVELTPPYMHDGRFRTLEEVLLHYTNGIKVSATLDPQLVYGIKLNAEERAKVILFLKTLTDRSFIENKKFTNPFLK
ncbi:MAG TPA: cytochrome c peroxidase [Cyclobacteriaceae bacterium]|nr:cytochrome c peroxidase [Cyclobacteriaceae bacterium]